MVAGLPSRIADEVTTVGEAPAAVPPAPAIDAVIFDFHGTLFDSHDPFRWVHAARRHLRRNSDGRTGTNADVAAVDVDVAEHLRRIWAHARTIDPDSHRDLDHDRHQEVFCRAAMLLPGVDHRFADALYTVMADQWMPYDDTVPVLRALKERGIRTALLSNIGRDVRPRLRSSGVADFLDLVVLSYEAGVAKPDPRIFALTLDRLGVAAGRALMVGDDAHDDIGGTCLGLRTLVLPRTAGPIRGLAGVLHLALSTSPR